MKSLIQRARIGTSALMSIGVVACADSDDGKQLFGHDIVLTGNGGSGDISSQGGSSGSGDGGSSGAGGSSSGVGGTVGSGGTDAAAAGGTAGSGTGGTDGSGTGGTAGSGAGGIDGSDAGGVDGGVTDGGGADPVNLLPNPDFELGVSGWSAAFGGSLSASSAQAHGGAQSALVSSRSATYQGAHVDVTSIVEQGATYAVGAFARIGNAASDIVKLTACVQCDGRTDQYVPIDSATGSDSAWTGLSGNLVVPKEIDCFLNQVLIYAEGPASGVDLYVDDARLEKTAAPEPLDNLITNSDFEAGIAGWSAAFGGTIAASTAQAHGGAQSAVVSNRTQTYQGAFVDMTSLVTPGETYAFRAFARLGLVSSGDLNLTARVQCASLADDYEQIDTLTGSDSSWSLLTGNLAVPAPAACALTSLLVYVEGAPVGADIYVDDVWAVLVP